MRKLKLFWCHRPETARIGAKLIRFFFNEAVIFLSETLSTCSIGVKKLFRVLINSLFFSRFAWSFKKKSKTSKLT